MITVKGGVSKKTRKKLLQEDAMEKPGWQYVILHLCWYRSKLSISLTMDNIKKNTLDYVKAKNRLGLGVFV